VSITEDIALTWQFTSEVLIALLTAAITFVLGLVSTRWWKTPGVIYFSFLMIMVGGWALFSGFESATVPIPVKIFSAKMQYVDIAFIATFWLLLALQYTHQDFKMSKWWVAALLVIPALSVYAVITEDQHHWLWQTIVPISNAPGAPLKFTYSWWYSISTAYFYLQLLVGIFILVQGDHPPKPAGASAAVIMVSFHL
jgi:hypothetical protein